MRPELQWADVYRDATDGKLKKHFPTHEGQKAFLESPARFTGVFAGSGGGKTCGGALWLFHRVVEDPTARYMVVSPDYSMFNRSVKMEIDKVFFKTPFQPKWTEKRHTYTLPQGGVIFACSADDPLKLASGQMRSIWIDEGSKITNAAWQELLSRTRLHKGRILITTTPDTFNWCYKDVYQRWLAGDPDYKCVHFSSFANPVWGGGDPLAEYERAKATMSEDKFRMRYDGQFTRSKSLIYPNLSDCLIDEDELPENYQSGDLVGGIDFGFKDVFAALAGYLYDDVLYLIYERYVSGLTLEQHYADMPKQPITWYADSACPGSIKTLKRLGMYVRPTHKGPGSIEYGINKVESRIRTGGLKIVRGSVQALLEEAESYHYETDEDGNPRSDKPASLQKDHACDCLRYLIESIDRNNFRNLTRNY